MIDFPFLFYLRKFDLLNNFTKILIDLLKKWASKSSLYCTIYSCREFCQITSYPIIDWGNY